MSRLVLISLFVGCAFDRQCGAKGRFEPAREVGKEVALLLCEAAKIQDQKLMGTDIGINNAGELEKWAKELEERTKEMSEAEKKEAMKRYNAEVRRCMREMKKKNDK